MLEQQPTVEPILSKPSVSHKKLLVVILLIILVIAMGTLVLRKKRRATIQVPRMDISTFTTLEQNLNTFSEHISSFEENSSMLDEINQSYELK